MLVTMQARAEFLTQVSDKWEQLIEANECIRWHGPTSERNVPMFVHGKNVISAYKFAYAMGQDLQETPSSDVRLTCGHIECVNPTHLTVRVTGRTGRRRLPINERSGYLERKAAVKQLYAMAGDVPFKEIQEALRTNKLLGNTNVLSKIVREVRAELGLPPRHRKPHQGKTTKYEVTLVK